MDWNFTQHQYFDMWFWCIASYKFMCLGTICFLRYIKTQKSRFSAQPRVPFLRIPSSFSFLISAKCSSSADLTEQGHDWRYVCYKKKNQNKHRLHKYTGNLHTEISNWNSRLPSLTKTALPHTIYRLLKNKELYIIVNSILELYNQIFFNPCENANRWLSRSAPNTWRNLDIPVHQWMSLGWWGFYWMVEPRPFFLKKWININHPTLIEPWMDRTWGLG